jgi:hypothetical protein
MSASANDQVELPHLSFEIGWRLQANSETDLAPHIGKPKSCAISRLKEITGPSALQVFLELQFELVVLSSQNRNRRPTLVLHTYTQTG